MALMLWAFWSMVYPIVCDMHMEHVEVTVTDKLRAIDGALFMSHKYMIFTENKKGEILVFEDSDSLLRLKYNSSDFYAKIKIGETYRFTVVGYRIPFLSDSPNIIKIEKMER
jgi:hypothetical protein